MHVENLRNWLDGKYVSPPDFKESLAHVIKDYERLRKEMFEIKKREVFPLPEPNKRNVIIEHVRRKY